MANAKRKVISKELREAVYRKYNGHCAYCGEKITYREMQVDHFAPVYLFGDNISISNLMPACRMCNFRKGTLTVTKFREELEKTVERLRRDSFMFRMAEKYGIINVHYAPVVFYYETHKENIDGDLAK